VKLPAPRARRRARLEIIPLIDVIFFLLATFMLVSVAMVKNKGIFVNLPAAAMGAPQPDAGDSVLTITKEGAVFFNKEPLRLDQLPARLTELEHLHSDPKVYINGDEKAYFGAAVEVLDKVRQAGITKIAIRTKAKE
jgi:biopolymer transport protein ExbD